MSNERSSVACIFCGVAWLVIVPGLWGLFGVLAFYDKPGWGWALFGAFISMGLTCRRFCLSADDYVKTINADRSSKSGQP